MNECSTCGEEVNPEFLKHPDNTEGECNKCLISVIDAYIIKELQAIKKNKNQYRGGSI